jgi:hypothetical protein
MEIVIASEACRRRPQVNQSRAILRDPGLLRYARNDGLYLFVALCLCAKIKKDWLAQRHEGTKKDLE